MVRLERREGELVLVFSAEDLEKYRLNGNVSFEIVSTLRGPIVLLEGATLPETASPLQSPKETPKTNIPPVLESHPADAKIFGLLSDKTFMAKRIVGSFEKQLNPEELKRFQDLLKSGIVEPFRLNESYKNHIYRLSSKKSQNQSVQTGGKKDLSDPPSSEDLSMTKNGFVIVKNEQEARDASRQMEDRIKAGEVRGIKGFDGAFYIVETRLYQEYSHKIIAVLRGQPHATVQEIAKGISTGVFFVQVLCEFLKDDGLLFEKRKGLFKLIE